MSQSLANRCAVISIEQLEQVACCFADLAESLHRPMTAAERAPWHWIAEAFYLPSMRRQAARLSPARQNKLADLFANIERIVQAEDDKPVEEVYVDVMQPSLFESVA